VNKAAPLVTVTYRNRRISPSEVAQNPVNPIMTDKRDVPSVHNQTRETSLVCIIRI